MDFKLTETDCTKKVQIQDLLIRRPMLYPPRNVVTKFATISVGTDNLTRPVNEILNILLSIKYIFFKNVLKSFI